MKHILKPDEMRIVDSIAINNYGIPSIVLMENAAREAADQILELFEDEGTEFQILILCGSGNNGGDGFALARHLYDFFNVKVIRIGDASKMSAETAINYNAALNIGVPIDFLEREEQIEELDLYADCIVDALIGVGGSEDLKGIAVKLLHEIKHTDAYKIALDAPTGLNTLTGAAHKYAFEADLTITMYALKTGLLLNDGPEKCGDVAVAYLGAPDNIVEKNSRIHYLNDDDLIDMLPERKRISSKFDYGRVLILAGSETMPGAAALAANSAIASGAGHVYLASSAFHSSLAPEVIPLKMSSTSDGTISIHSYEVLVERMEQCQVLALGSGLGENEETYELVRKLVERFKNDKVIIIDADGLKAFPSDYQFSKNVILTPHTGELAKFTKLIRENIEKDAPSTALHWANKTNSILLLKHVPSIITDGKESVWNLTGNPGMATAGSGDVLTGIIAGIASQNGKAFDSAALGAYIHGKAGDAATEDYGYIALTASKIIDYLPEAYTVGGEE